MHLLTRRSFLQNSLQLAPFVSTPGLFAERLSLTPHQTEGPFYPDHLPLDTDNDLLILNDSITPAVGTVTYLSGAVLDRNGSPVQNALVEIWQVDSRGVYLHSRGGSREKRDSHFQGYGRFLTNSKGKYSFRTLKPSPYSGRTPHIHFAVSSKGKRLLTTQCYIKGEPRNKTDFILNKIKDPKIKESLLVPFNPIRGSKTGEASAKFDIALGITPSN
jgi:protocatechuate 3,4-dioxygenase beta subunit